MYDDERLENINHYGEPLTLKKEKVTGQENEIHFINCFLMLTTKRFSFLLKPSRKEKLQLNYASTRHMSWVFGLDS